MNTDPDRTTEVQAEHYRDANTIGTSLICNDLQIPILDMPRRPGICPAGTCFHVINRAVARLPLFEKEGDDLHDASSCNLARRDGKVVLLDRGG